MRFAMGNHLVSRFRIASSTALAASLLAGLLLPAPLLAEEQGEEVPTKVIKMTVENFKWVPNEIAVKKGTHVTLRIRGYDATHRFDLKKPYNVKVLIPQGATTDVEFVAKYAGKFKWKCGRPCGDGCPKMTGKLTVYEPGGGAEAEDD